jgi:hypothetical protein
VTAHKRLRVNTNGKLKNGVIAALVGVLHNGVTAGDTGDTGDTGNGGKGGKGGKGGNAGNDLLWDAMKSACVIHDPTGRVKEAMDVLGRTLLSTSANTSNNNTTNTNTTNTTNNNNNNTTTTNNTNTIFLTAECLKAQMALRISEPDESWYHRMLPAVVAWMTAAETSTNTK